MSRELGVASFAVGCALGAQCLFTGKRSCAGDCPTYVPEPNPFLSLVLDLREAKLLFATFANSRSLKDWVKGYACSLLSLRESVASKQSI